VSKEVDFQYRKQRVKSVSFGCSGVEGERMRQSCKITNWLYHA
jgi:hypothetical protein